MSYRRLSVLLLALAAACGGTAPPPKAPTAVDVTPAKGAGPAVAPAAPAAAEDDVVVPITADDATRGSRLAYATVVVFSDFECPACAAFRGTLEKAQSKHGVEAVRVVFKNYPLAQHPNARVAAEIGQGVLATRGAEAFWRYHDLAFGRQDVMDRAMLLSSAESAGADAREIEAGLDKKRWAAKVDRDRDLGDKLGILGTPSIFVNGLAIERLDAETFEQAVDEQVEKGKSLAGRGVPRDRVYARLAAANYVERPAEPEEEPEPPVDPTVWKVPAGKSPARGDGKALVTIVEFSDFQCPFCKKVEPTLERLRTEYGDKLRIVWKDQPLPFHPRAEPAANLARAARAQKGEAAFWDVHDRLFAAAPNLEDPDLEQVARAAGLDVKKAMAAVKAKTYAKVIDDDQALAEDVQASGTPHFFVNGRRLVGAQPYDKFKALVDEELAKAEALVQAGTARADLYETIIKDGKAAPEPDRKTVAAPASAAPFLGAANAPVVIHQFSDFQCPFCARAEATMTALVKAYPGRVKVVWRDLPLVFHKDAELAAEAAREAFAQKGNAGFAKMRALLFEHQRDQDGLKRDALESYAKKIGLDAKRFAKALDDHTHKAAIDADKKAAADAGIRGTPGFVVGPFFVSGAQSLRKFRRAVDLALAEGKGGGAKVAAPRAAAPKGAAPGKEKKAP